MLFDFVHQLVRSYPNLTLHVHEANEHEQGVRPSVVFADVA
jgi:hypothetical protein